MSLLKKLRPELFEKLQARFDDNNLNRIENAVELASNAHQNQFRKTGEPYILHPLAVADLLNEIYLDADTIIAAILHDVPEDTQVTLDQINKKFGKTVTNIVDGMTKLSRVRLKKEWFGILGVKKEKLTSFERQVETLRKMIMATSKDVRIIIIKLADRIHNMRTIEGISPEKRLRFAKETLDIYAPIAERLNISKWKGELEDLTFPIVYPQEYRRIDELISKQLVKKKKQIDKIIKSLLKHLCAENIKIIKISGRVKHKYSYWKKLRKFNDDHTKIHDLVAIRVITDTQENCYKILSVIHEHWKPLSGLIKDYIAQPKPNGYQSLHTTIYGPSQNIVEIQIRTQTMHKEAEEGIASHWYYSQIKNQGSKSYINKNLSKVNRSQLIWLKELAKWQKSIKDPGDLGHALTYDFFKDRIFVYTPQGDIKDLPDGSTPIDFAYSIHTDIGNSCVGSKVNGKLVGFSQQLKNGDVVEIITKAKSSGPKRDWLDLVKTSVARNKIKKQFKI